jgi:hypothetical protein
VAFGLRGDDCPSQAVAMHIARSPAKLLALVHGVAVATPGGLVEIQRNFQAWLADPANAEVVALIETAGVPRG